MSLTLQVLLIMHSSTEQFILQEVQPRLKAAIAQSVPLVGAEAMAGGPGAVSGLNGEVRANPVSLAD